MSSFLKFDEDETNMNNVNVNFEIENSIINFLINKRENIINIQSVEDNHRINFVFTEKNEINKIFNEFYYNNINRYNKDCIYVFVIAVV